MKKCVIGVLCVLSFSMMIFISCNKKDRSAPVVVLPQNLPGNPLNPYDSFGYWHNLILDSLDAERAKGKCKDLASYATYGSKFCKAKGWMKPAKRASSHEEITQKIVDFANDPHGFVNQMQWSDSVKSRLIGLFTRLDKEGETNCSFEKLKATIVGFEQEVLVSSLPEMDKEVILKASSTARFSGYRWNARAEFAKPYESAEMISFFQQQDIPLTMAKTSQKEKGFFKRVGRWIAVTSIDIMGAVHYLSAAEGAVVSGYAGLTMDLMDNFI